MALTTKYIVSGESAIASYDASDLITKTGYLTLYAIGGNDGTIFLSPIQTESSPEYLYTTDSSDAGTVVEKELDIDITFKSPQTVKGKLFVTYTVVADNVNGATTTDVFSKCRIYHVDLSNTETEIGTQQTTATRTAASGSHVVTYGRETVVFEITGQHFKIGEKLRLNIELWGSITGVGFIRIYHDGLNRDITQDDLYNANVPTDIKCVIPFKVDL